MAILDINRLLFQHLVHSADFADASSAAVIKNALADQRFARANGADDLTLAGIHSLMRLGGSRGAASEFALMPWRQPGFRNTASLKLEQESVRKELADFVSGRKTRAEMSPESRAATFNSGFPRLLHSLLREQGAGVNDVDELVTNARYNYDDATIRAAMNRVELYNALPPQVRDRILGPSQNGERPERMDALSVFGQMANGTLESSPESLVLDPLEDRVKEFKDGVALQRTRGFRRLSK